MSWFTECIGNINKVKIPHRNWTHVLSEAHAALLASNPGEVVCLVGPSRCGKSRLITELSKRVTGGTSHINKGEMPCVTIEAENSGSNGTLWTSSLIVNGLSAIRHPIFFGIDEVENWYEHQFKSLGIKTESKLRSALVAGLKGRKTLYLFIDEAQHVMYAKGGEKAAAAILDSWKGMAKSANVVLVLVGAYPLLNVLTFCPHLLGRKIQIHFPRYYSTDEDILCFNQILQAYDKCIGLDTTQSSLCDWSQLIHKETFGCIGLVNKWLRKALAYAHAKNRTTLTKSDLIATKETKSELAVIAKEIADGEKALEPQENQYDNPQDSIETVNSVPPDDLINKKKNRKPFERKPVRYKINGRV